MSKFAPTPETPHKTPSRLLGLLRWFLLFVATLVLVVSLIVTFVDLSSLRQPVAGMLSRSTGLKVDIAGLGLDWSGGLGLRAEGITVLSPDGDRTLFSSEALFLKVRWVPLFEGKYEVVEAEMVKPVIQIMSPAVSHSHPAPAPHEVPPPISSQQVGLTSLRNLLLGLHLNAERVHVQEALVLWMPPENSPADPLQVQTSFEVKVRRPDAQHLDVQVHDLVASLGKLVLTGELNAKDVLSTQGRLEGKVTIKPLDLNTLDSLILHFPESIQKQWRLLQPAGQLEAFSLSAAMPTRVLFEKPVPQPGDVQARLNARLERLVLQPPPDRPNLRLGLPKLDLDLDWSGGTLGHVIQADLGDATLKAQGILKPPPPAGGPLTLESTVHLPPVSSGLLNAWLPPEWRLVKGKVQGQVQIQGDVKTPGTLAAQGTVSGEDWVLASQRDKHLQLPLQRMEGSFQWNNGRLQIPSLKLMPPHGGIQAKGQFQPGTRAFGVEFKGDALRIEDFYRQNVDGDLSLQGKLDGVLPKKSRLLDALSGPVHVMAQNGRLYQLEPLRALLAVLNPLSVAQLGNKGLPYHTFGGDFALQQGTIATQNLRLTTPEMKVYMAGTAAPSADRIDMQGRFQPSQAIDQTIGQIPILGDILKGGKKGGVIETRFKLQGSLRKPKVVIDAKNSILGKGADMLRELGKVPQKVTP